MQRIPAIHHNYTHTTPCWADFGVYIMALYKIAMVLWSQKGTHGFRHQAPKAVPGPTHTLSDKNVLSLCLVCSVTHHTLDRD